MESAVASVADLFRSQSLTLRRPSATPADPFAGLINVPPAPGDFDLGGFFGGIVTDIVQRLPRIPRPTLPAPRGPTRGPTGRGPLPIPIPIPIPEGLFGGNGGCPGGAVNPCCSGEHLDKATMSRCVSNRRMNFGNTRALKRAIRRAKGFERLVKSNRKSLRSLAKI